MRLIFFLLLLLFTTLGTKAQFSLTSQTDAHKIKDVILLIAFQEEDEKVLKKYAKKPEILELYSAQIEGKNVALKYAAENYWTFSKEIEYMGEKAAKALIAEETDKYVMLHYGKFEDFQYEKTGYGSNGQPAGWTRTRDANGILTSKYNQSTKYTVLTNIISTLEISGATSISKIFMPNFYPSQSDVVTCMQMMQYVLRYLTESPENGMLQFMAKIASNAPELKELTLLIDNKDVDKKLTEKKIKELYPYKVEIVDQEIINNAIMKKDPQFAIVQIADAPAGNGNVSTHYIIGAADGKVYCLDMPRIVVQFKGFEKPFNERITDKNVINYAKNIK